MQQLSLQIGNGYQKRINIEMSWKKYKSYDVDIEAGAYYNGRWVDQSLE